MRPAAPPDPFRLSPEEHALRTFIARAGADVFRPLADAWGERDELNRDLVRAMGAEGVFPLLIPAAYSGALDGPFRSMTLCLVREELARTCPAAEALFAIQGLGSYPILLAGTGAQQARYLPALARGAEVPVFALTEPEAGSDVAGLRTRAKRDGDACVLTGTKRFISNASAADLYVVFARTAPDRGAKGISTFLAIYEGTSEIQRLIIARRLLRE